MKKLTLTIMLALGVMIHGMGCAQALAQTVPLDHFDGGRNLTQGNKIGSKGTLAEILRSLEVSISGSVSQSITNGATTVAPSSDAVFDALALKQDAAKLIAYDSAASLGGGVSETVTVTGLGVSDTILAVSQKTAGANGTAPIAFGSPALNSLSVTWTANPGAGAVLRVYVKKP